MSSQVTRRDKNLSSGNFYLKHYIQAKTGTHLKHTFNISKIWLSLSVLRHVLILGFYMLMDGCGTASVFSLVLWEPLVYQDRDRTISGACEF